jgi:hypothetical protein
MLLTSPSLSLVVAGIGGLFITVLIVIVGTRLLTSARAAEEHLASGMALTPRIGAAVSREAAGGPASAAAPALPDGDPSDQIFAQLNHYYAANISQGNAIFWASLLSMSVGFAMIFAGIVTAGVNGTTAIVAGIAGVLSQFIGATFLVALRSTQAQATTYAQSLVELRLRDVRAAADARSVALGLRLLSEIPDEGANGLANQTRATLVTGLIVKETVLPPAATVAPPPVEVDDADRTGARIEPRRAASVSFDAGAAPRTPER